MQAAAPQSSGSNIGIILAIVLGGMVLFGGCVGAGALLYLKQRSADDSYTTRSNYSSSGGSSRSSDDDTKEVGDRVTLDDSTWTILDVRDMGKHIDATADYMDGEELTTTGRFIRVHYKVQNDGKKQETLLDTPKIVDHKSREFGPVQGESEYVPKGAKTAILETIQPSMEKDFYTIIEVPADATDLEIEVTGLGLLGDKKRISTDL